MVKARRTKEIELRKAVSEPRVAPYLMEGEDAPETFDRINKVIDSKYGGNPKLKVLQLTEGQGGLQRIVGSSPLILPIVAQVISPKYGLARPEEVETTLQDGDTLGIEGNHYVDYGLVLDFSGNNHALAVETFNSLPKSLRELERFPAVMIGYGLRNSKKGSYGVKPVYQKGTELRTANILSQPTGNFDAHDSHLLVDGIPSKLGEGKRKLYNPTQHEHSMDSLGLSRLYLYGSLILNSGGGDLAGSLGVGRVVVVSGEAAGENFARQYANKLKAEQDARKKALDEWFEESMTDMPGK